MSELKTCVIADSGNIVSPRGRAFFCAIAKKFKKKGKKDDDGQYVVTLLIPPDADLELLEDAVKTCAAEKWGQKLPKNLKSPIREASDVLTDDGDPKYPEEYQDYYQITANTYKTQPGVIDAKGVKVNTLRPGESQEDVQARMEEECFQGRWMRISVSPATFDTDGNRGVKLYLQGVQLLDKDDVLGGFGGNAEKDFSPVDMGEKKGAKKKSAASIFD